MANVGVLGLRWQEGVGRFVVELLPPQREEEHPVLNIRQDLLDPILEVQGVLVLRIRGEPEISVGRQYIHLRDQSLVLAYDFEERRLSHLGGQAVTSTFEGLHHDFQRSQALDDDFFACLG